MSNDNTTASRRGFLGGLTAVGAAGVPAAARALGGLPTSTAGEDAELFRLIEQHRQAKLKAEGLCEASEGCAYDAAVCRMCDAEDAVLATPARTLGGLAAKARMVLAEIGVMDGHEEYFLDMARCLARDIIALGD
jgi:hypothetical protein